MKKKLLFIYYQNIKQNGVSRVLANLTWELCERGYQIEVLFLMAPHEDFYAFHPNIKKHYIDSFAHKSSRLGVKIYKKYKNIPKSYNLYSYLYDWGSYNVLRGWLKENHHQYDKIITCWYKLSSMLSLDKEICKKTIAWEHISYETGGLIWFKFLRKYYKNLNGIIPINKAGYDFYKQINPNTYLIYNIIGEPFEETEFISPSEKSNLITFAGRLVYDKNPLEFLEIIQKADLPADWKVIIAGDGTERHELESFVLENKIRNIEFVGRKSSNEIYELFKKSKIFCLTSRVEGLPTVLLEAMFCSNALVSYDCKYGPADIINERNGYLIPQSNKNIFIEKLRELTQNQMLLDSLMKSSYEETRFWKKENVIKQWEKVL